MNTPDPSTEPDPRLHSLLTCLRERLALVEDREFYQRDPAGHLEALQKKSAELEELARGLHGLLAPMLQHYLDRQSYIKAKDWLASSLESSR